MYVRLSSPLSHNGGELGNIQAARLVNLPECLRLRLWKMRKVGLGGILLAAEVPTQLSRWGFPEPGSMYITHSHLLIVCADCLCRPQ